jgi:hypothetical protein
MIRGKRGILQKPVTVTITMKGGGGLSSLRDFPIIKRVSGGDVVDGDFFGGYTDEMAGYPDESLDYYDAPGRARTTASFGGTRPLGFNPAAGYDTMDPLAGGTARPFREYDDPGAYPISTPERSENREAQLNFAKQQRQRANAEAQRVEAENAARNEVDAVASTLLGYYGPDGRAGRYGDDEVNLLSDYGSWTENIPTYAGGLFNLATDDAFLTGGDYGKWTENIPTADDLFVDDEEYQLMGQRPEQKEKIKEIKEYLDKVNKKSDFNFGKTWKAAKEIVNKPEQAAFTLSNIIRNRDRGVPELGDVPIPDSFVKIAQEWRQTEADLDRIDKEEGVPDSVKVDDTPSSPFFLKAAKGGGLSSLQEMPMVYRENGGVTDNFDLEDAEFGGGVDAIGTPDVYGEFGIGVDDQDRLAVLRGLGKEEGEETGAVDTAAEAFLGFLPSQSPSTLNAIEKALPDFLPFVRSDKEIEEQEKKELDFTKGEYVTGVYDKDGKFVSAEGLSRLAGYTPETAETEMKRQGAISKYSNKVKDIDKIEGLTTKQKNERKEEAAKNIMSEVRQTGGIPGVFSTLLLEGVARAGGVIAVGEIDGKGVHIHNDGKITYVSPEDDPTYDKSLDVGSSEPEKKGIEKVKKELKKVGEEETKPTGVASLVTRESKIPESNEFLDTLLRGLYKDIPEETLLAMTGTSV